MEICILYLLFYNNCCCNNILYVFIDLFRFIYSSPSEDPFINEEEKKYIEEDFLKKNVFFKIIYRNLN